MWSPGGTDTGSVSMINKPALCGTHSTSTYPRQHEALVECDACGGDLVCYRLSCVTIVSMHACLTSFLRDDHVDGHQCALTEGFHFAELPQVLVKLTEDLICAQRLRVLRGD